jgi:hypothetical protein
MPVGTEDTAMTAIARALECLVAGEGSQHHA